MIEVKTPFPDFILRPFLQKNTSAQQETAQGSPSDWIITVEGQPNSPSAPLQQLSQDLQTRIFLALLHKSKWDQTAAKKGVHDLVALSQTCKYFHQQVSELFSPAEQQDLAEIRAFALQHPLLKSNANAFSALLKFAACTFNHFTVRSSDPSRPDPSCNQRIAANLYQSGFTICFAYLFFITLDQFSAMDCHSAHKNYMNHWISTNKLEDFFSLLPEIEKKATEAQDICYKTMYGLGQRLEMLMALLTALLLANWGLSCYFGQKLHFRYESWDLNQAKGTALLVGGGDGQPVTRLRQLSLSLYSSTTPRHTPTHTPAQPSQSTSSQTVSSLFQP